MTIDFATVGTDSFYDNYSSNKLSDMSGYAEDVWEDNIEDSTSTYDGLFQVFNSSAVSIPESSLCSGCSLRDRVQTADTWLSNNWSLYSSYDVVQIADYYGSGSDRGVAQQHAGTYNYKCTLVDVEKLENVNDEWAVQGSEGVNAHEMLHMFIDEGGSEHYPAARYGGYTTLMYDSDIASWCPDNGTPTFVDKDVSSCTRDKVREWIDNNI